MSFEQITVVADGQVYDEWASITITADWGSPVTLIDLETTEVMEESAGFDSPFTKWNFPPGTILSVFATGIPVALAVVDTYRPSGWPNSHKVSIQARSPGRKGVDNSIDPNNIAGSLANIPYCQLVRILWASISGGVAVPVGCDPSLESEMIRYYQLKMGATPYAETMRLAPLAGAQIRPILSTGGIHLAGTEGEMIHHSGGYVVQGANIISMSAEIVSFPRAATIEAVAQDPLDMNPELLELKATDRDSGAPPGSYKLHLVQGFPTPNNLKNYVKWMRALNFAQSVKARIQVPGWRIMHPDAQGVLQPMSKLWSVGELVTVWSKWLKINCDMLIIGVEFHQDSKSGTTTTLKLSDPRVAGVGTFTPCNEGNNIWIWD